MDTKHMAESSKTPVQSNQRRLQILDEDTYTEAISHIIERDFFPNLTKLKAQQQYLEAYENGDLLSLQSATRALAELAQTPLSGSPGSTPRKSTSSPLQGIRVSQRSVIGEQQPGLSSRVDLNLSLDQFQTKYTSEDNASFTELVEKVNSRTREKYRWIFNKETHQLTLQDKDEDLKNDKSITTGEESKDGVIDSWNYQARNTLMYYPEGKSTSVLSDDARGAPRAILHGNTRFIDKEISVICLIVTASTLKLPPSMEDAQRGILTPWRDLRGDSRTPESSIDETYGFVAATPSPNPSRMGTPLMTWGTIDGTPMLITGNETPGGASFKLPQPSKREEVAMRLSNKASQNIRKRNQPDTGRITKSSPIARLASPSLRRSILSPAARHLLKRSDHTPTADASLRASYTSSKAQGTWSHKSTPSSTPN